jgi:RNA polymerase sigma factor (sigma-70 family)
MTLDVSARNALVTKNLRLAAWYVARYYGRRHRHFEDLVQEAAIGLVTAAERFDPARGVTFATYAKHCMRGRTSDALMRADGEERGCPPFGGRGLGSRPRPETYLPSLDAAVHAAVSSGEPTPEDRVASLEARRAVRTAIAQALTETGRGALADDLVTSRLLSDSPDSLPEIGKRHGKSREWARLTEARIIEHAREALTGRRAA